MTAPDSQLTRPVWVEVNLEHIVFNLDLIRERVGQGTEIMAVVKADAYGHGMIPVARKLVDAGVARLAVALPEEGVELREAGLTLPIQVMGELLSAQYPLIIDYDLVPTVAGMESARAINELASLQGKIKQIHIKVDTGMGRIGAQSSEALELIREISELPFIEIEGIMTHFASADEADKEYTYYQWERFDFLLRELAEKGISIPIKHAANSAAILDLPQFNLDLVRPGIILYGMMPSSEVDQSLPFKPALSWKTRIVFLKEVGEGSAISYGSTFVTQRRSRIATIPLGYADGYSRLLSNKGQVLVNGLRASVVGRICMDQFMIDVSDIPDAAVGDEVVLIGRQGEEEITAMEMADLIGTINYEITCSIARRVPRIYL